jgi:putative aldouronate transport system permease protein
MPRRVRGRVRSANKLNLHAVLYRIVQQASMNYLANDVVGSGDRAMVREQAKYATIIVATAPILVGYPILKRYFIKGVLIDATKG